MFDGYFYRILIYDFEYFWTHVPFFGKNNSDQVEVVRRIDAELCSMNGNINESYR